MALPQPAAKAHIQWTAVMALRTATRLEDFGSMSAARNGSRCQVAGRRGCPASVDPPSPLGELKARHQRFLAEHVDRSVEADGRRWHYLMGGHGSDAVLVLPGGSMCPDSYFQLIGVLEREHRVIAPTYPAASTIADLVHGLVAVLDAERLAPVAVFGASFGGYVAQVLVRLYPQRVDRLVLSHTAIRHPAGRRSMTALAALLSVLPDTIVRAVMWRVWMRLFSVRSAERTFWRGMLHGVLDRLSKAQLVAVMRCMADFAGYHMKREDLAGWTGDVLILESAHDAAYGQAARAELRATYPAATVHTFHDAGHTALWTHAAEYNEVIRSFLVEPPLAEISS